MMTSQINRSAHQGALKNLTIEILEDDWLVARDLQDTIENAGAAVSGPFSTAEAAINQLAVVPPDVAIVDLNLHGSISLTFPRLLKDLGIPFAFYTAYGRSVITGEFDDVVFLEKFPRDDQVIDAIAKLSGRSVQDQRRQ